MVQGHDRRVDQDDKGDEHAKHPRGQHAHHGKAQAGQARHLLGQGPRGWLVGRHQVRVHGLVLPGQPGVGTAPTPLRPLPLGLAAVFLTSLATQVHMRTPQTRG